MQPLPPKPKLSDAGLQPGDVITFWFDDTVTATVKSEHRIVFEGKTTTINAAAVTLLRREGFTQRSVNGWYYWSFKGELLGFALMPWLSDNPGAFRPDDLMEMQTLAHFPPPQP